MKFTIHINKHTVISIDEVFWKRAFNYAARQLNIEHHHATVDCFFIPIDFEKMVKFKYFSLGATSLTEQGAVFYVVTAAHLALTGQMVKTFFHELTHVKQLLMGELVAKRKARSIVWKGEKWDKREYAFAPWEAEANTFSDKSYDRFLRREVTRIMADENAHAYDVHAALRGVFPQDDVFQVTRGLHREREKCAPAASSERDWLMLAS